MGTHKTKPSASQACLKKKAALFPTCISIDCFFHHILCINCKHNKQINERMYIVYFIIHKNIFEILFSYIIYSE